MANKPEDSKPIGLELNSEQSKLLLKGLDALPDVDKRSVVYQSLKRDVETIVVIWERIIKNQKLIKEQQKLQRIKK